MAAPSLVGAEYPSVYTATTSKATGLSDDAVVHDLIAIVLSNTAQQPQASIPGATLEALDVPEGPTFAGTADSFEIYRVTAAGSGTLTVFTASDDFNRHTVQWVRPPAGVEIAATDLVGSNENASDTNQLTVTLSTTGSPALLVAFGGSNIEFAWTTDSNWTNLDDTGELTCQYRESDDSQWIADKTSVGNAPIVGAVVEYVTAAETHVDRGAPRGTRRGTQRGVHRMKLKNGLWRPLFPGRIIPVPAGAF